MAKYRVTGRRTIQGHPPGSVFEAELDPKHEARMLRAGFLTKARANAKEREGGDADDDNEGGDD
jgi:hypothetical protein